MSGFVVRDLCRGLGLMPFSCSCVLVCAKKKWTTLGTHGGRRECNAWAHKAHDGNTTLASSGG